jgi:hypothetical protein
VFRTALYAFKVHNGITASPPVFANQLGIGCLLAIFAPRLPKIKSYWALLMLQALICIPWFSLISATRTLFYLFVLEPVLNVSIAGAGVVLDSGTLSRSELGSGGLAGEGEL